MCRSRSCEGCGRETCGPAANVANNLRSLGFRTFDGIVDESYDTIEQIDKRIDAACCAANSLVTVNDQDLLQEIVEHNYQNLMSTDWNKQMTQQLEKVIAGIQ